MKEDTGLGIIYTLEEFVDVFYKIPNQIKPTSEHSFDKHTSHVNQWYAMITITSTTAEY